MPSSAMPSEHSDMPMSHVESKETHSLVKPPVMKAKKPILLWLIVVLLLGGTGFLGYMVYNQQNILVAFQDSLTQWTTQVTTLQSSYDTSLRAVNDKLLTLETSTSTMQQNMELMKTARTAEPSPTMEPTMIPEEPGMITESPSMGSGSGTSMEMPGESAFYEANLVSARQGDGQTTQPDGITLIKSRQMSEDGTLRYDVFQSKSNPSDIYMYIRKTDGATIEFPDGWYGPFTMEFPEV